MTFGRNIQNILEQSLHASVFLQVCFFLLTFLSTRKLKHTDSILVFRIFLSNVIKIDHYNFDLYRFKVCAFFETHCTIKSAIDGDNSNRNIRTKTLLVSKLN